MELILLFQAESDIQEAFEYYEDRQEGRGVVFLIRVDEALELIRENPAIGPTYRKSLRRMLVKGFPYGIFYEIQRERIVVSVVANLRQNINGLHRRLFGPASDFGES